MVCNLFFYDDEYGVYKLYKLGFNLCEVLV